MEGTVYLASNWQTFTLPLVVAACLAALVLLITLIAVLVRKIRTGSRPKISWVWAHVWTDSAWSTQDSWATNIAGAGAILTAIAAAAGSSNFLQDIAPSFSIDNLTALVILLGGAAALSPLAYSALAPGQSGAGAMAGTVLGLALASFLTLFAVFGQLAIIAVIIYLSTTSGGVSNIFEAALAVATAIPALYGVRSIYALCVTNRTEGVAAASFLKAGKGSSATL